MRKSLVSFPPFACRAIEFLRELLSITGISQNIMANLTAYSNILPGYLSSSLNQHEMFSEFFPC
jgi:hypothetical protein